MRYALGPIALVLLPVVAEAQFVDARSGVAVATCAEEVRRTSTPTMPRFDAYVRPKDGVIVRFGNKEQHYLFEKCLTFEGIDPKAAVPVKRPPKEIRQ